MGCHAGTGGDSSGYNGVVGFRDPVTGTKQIGHVVSIVQDSQAGLGISTEFTAFCQPVYNSSNVLNCADVSMLGASNLRRVAGYDFHHLRKKYDVPGRWGDIHPQWRLLQLNLDTNGPGWYPLSEREERLFTNMSNRPKDDMKDELRTDGDPLAWHLWSTAQNRLLQLRQPGPPVVFPGDQGIFTDMYTQVREEEQVISLQFLGSQQEVSDSRRNKRKQVDDGTAIV